MLFRFQNPSQKDLEFFKKLTGKRAFTKYPVEENGQPVIEMHKKLVLFKKEYEKAVNKDPKKILTEEGRKIIKPPRQHRNKWKNTY